MNDIHEDYRWLVGPEGRRWLGRAGEDRRGEVALAAALRKDLSAERTHLVLEQLALRRRGRAKFAAADRMFFTRLGLEQATDQVVAAQKAGRLSGGCLALDLCCGIGGDLLGMAARGPVVGVERDRVHALLAWENARLEEQDRATSVVAADVTRLRLNGDIEWHIDPDRRATGRRSTRVGWHSPGCEALEAMLDRAAHGAIKLAPAAAVPREWQGRAELEWISRGGQCRQLVVWFGRLAREAGRRRATILDEGAPRRERITGTEGQNTGPPLRFGPGTRAYSVVGRPGRAERVAGEVGRWVFEPDPAVLAGDLTGVLAARHGLEALTGGGGYLTGDGPVDEPMMECFEVLDVVPFDRRRVKRLLAGRGMGRLEVKTRGVRIEPGVVRRQLRVAGDQAGVLLLTRQAEKVTVIVARRVRDREE